MSEKKWMVRIGLVVILAGAGLFQFHLKRRPLVPRLISFNNDTRTMALSEIPKLPPGKRAEIALALVQFQNNPDARIRKNALYSLRQLGEPKPEVLDFCVRALSDSDPSVRGEALTALARFGDAAIPSLVAVLGTANGETLEGAMRILGGMEGRCVPALTALLKDPFAKGRGPAVRVLGRIGKPAKGTAPLLKGLLASGDPDLRLDAAEALQGLNMLPKGSAAALTADLLGARDSYKDGNAPRPRLARLLEKIDPRRRTLVDLGFDLKQKNAAIRYRAAYVISEMNPPNLGALEILVDSLEDPDVNVAARSLVALTRIGLDKTERLRRVAYPRMRSAARRAQAAKIDGFDDIVQPALKNLN